MHRCEVRLEKIPEDKNYKLTVGWFWSDLELSDEERSLPTCGAPASKKLGFVWVCDLHYRRHAGEEDEDDDLAAIIEGGTEADWAEEDAEQAASTDDE